MGSLYFSKLSKIYRTDLLKRIIILWIIYQLFIWVIFSIGYITHPQNWLLISQELLVTHPVSFQEIVYKNLLIILLIVIGNLTVRFSFITPGLILLTLKCLVIAWTIGTNSGAILYIDFLSASYQYFITWVWEPTAYVIACAITLPKSKYITKGILDKGIPSKIDKIRFNSVEKGFLAVSVLLLLIGALAETYLKWGFVK